MQKLPSLEPQHGKEELGVSGSNSTHLEVGVPLLVSHSLWVREEPVEMGGNGFSVQDLQPGRRNLSSGMQPHPVSTGNSGWPLAPLHCPQPIFPVKTPLQKHSGVRTQSHTHPDPLPNLVKQAALSFCSFSEQGIHTLLSPREASRQSSWQGCQL